ncbi:MAG: MAG1140 family protein [Metamycoplasmataceae bacterium]
MTKGVLTLKNLTTLNNNFINYIIIFLFSSFIFMLFISQLKIEKSCEALLNVDEDNGITLIINSADAYFINGNKTINFILNNKLYIVEDIVITPLPNNVFSIQINDKSLESILQPSTILKININIGVQKLYELFLKQ